MTFPNGGVLAVGLVGFGMLLLTAVFDWRLVGRDGQPVGRWVQAWARRFPVFALLLAAILGMLLGHFYWSTPPTCPQVAAGAPPPAGTDADCLRAGSLPP